MGPVSRGTQGCYRPGALGLFQYLNAGKRGVTLDFAPAGRLAAARELIAQAHVLVEDFAPGTLDGWGLGTDALSGSTQTWCCCAFLISVSPDPGGTGRPRR